MPVSNVYTCTAYTCRQADSQELNFVIFDLDALIWVLGLNVPSVALTLSLLLLVHPNLHALRPVDYILSENTSLQVLCELTPLLHTLIRELDALQVMWQPHLNLKILKTL